MSLVVIYPDARCRKCGGEMTYCHLYDKCGGHHWRIWCEPCYSLFCKSVTEEMRIEHDVPDRDALPLYLTLEQRGFAKGDKRRSSRYKGSGIGVDPAAVVLEPRKKNRLTPEGKKRLLSTQRSTSNSSAQMIAELRRMPYSKYLESNHWRKVRAAAIARAGYRCSLCNDTYLLVVHHRTYERRGCELPEDVICLCRKCHEKHHDIVP